MPVRANPVTSNAAIQESLPDLEVGVSHTHSSALHPITFCGNLARWPNFVRDVQSAFRTHRRRLIRSHLYLRPLGNPPQASTPREQVVVGNENGVQGRWQQQLGQVMSAVFRDQMIGLTLGDFPASVAVYGKRPDIACLTNAGVLRFIGELKTPWVRDHSILLAMVQADKEWFRHILGQIAEYMKDLNLTYGALSTYKQTIFLRQYHDPNLGWQLQYSPMVRHSSSASPGVMSVRQCIWYLAQEVLVSHQANNPTPKSQWVKPYRSGN
ncbi:hypothetical protein N8T08_001201 [Aspergillus melleus]|uniref:Uncharacterized protein n=1 Tax=Aspergillus melleus TaxID=138277 RepID=A0ACC3APC0_9EURO|nr:hypothetical protein N8T08_001201 [Aspergillus melleus]